MQPQFGVVDLKLAEEHRVQLDAVPMQVTQAYEQFWQVA